MFIIDCLTHVIQIIIRFFTRTNSNGIRDKKMKIYVKCGSENVIPVYLQPEWTIYQLKEDISSKIYINAEEVRIIFAGKELHNDIKLQDCDIGEQSIIHAVSSKKGKSSNFTVEAKCPLDQLVFCSDKSYDDIENDEKLTLKKHHFFVYCNDVCKSLSPGKLRVRCSKCKEGTLTVNEDPSCWDDVLISGRISGVCQAEGCDGNLAEFYFKCAKHASNSSSVPLYYIKNNFKNVPCIACTNISPLILVFPCNDGHVICLECFSLYCNSRLNERRFIQNETIGYSIDCPVGCPDSLIKEPHHFKLLGQEQYERYQFFGAEECLLQAGGVLCPQPGCGAGLLPDPECRRIVCVKNGETGCGFVFCRHCMQGFHIGPCESQGISEIAENTNFAISDERAVSSKWDEDSKRTIKITTKPCPKCRTPTERDGGCMHMVCTRTQCGFHWCWICQEEWTRDCMGNHWFG